MSETFLIMMLLCRKKASVLRVGTLFSTPCSCVARCLLTCVQVQGGILNFEVLRPDGTVFSYKTFEREAAEAGFHVRTGAECNPGACYNYLGVQVCSYGVVLGCGCCALCGLL